MINVARHWVQALMGGGQWNARSELRIPRGILQGSASFFTWLLYVLTFYVTPGELPKTPANGAT